MLSIKYLTHNLIILFILIIYLKQIHSLTYLLSWLIVIIKLLYNQMIMIDVGKTIKQRFQVQLLTIALGNAELSVTIGMLLL